MYGTGRDEPVAIFPKFSIRATIAGLLADTRISRHGVAGLDAHRRIAVGIERIENVVGVLAVAGLDGDVEPRALGRHVEEQPLVVDLEDVGAEMCEPGWDQTAAYWGMGLTPA